MESSSTYCSIEISDRIASVQASERMANDGEAHSQVDEARVLRCGLAYRVEPRDELCDRRVARRSGDV